MIKEVPHFILECPVCGRPLQVCIDYLGHSVTCQHCRGQFVASYPGSSEREKTERSISLLHRADRLLAMFARRLGVHRFWPLVRRHEDAEARDMPTVLLMEHRDDVFSRLAANLAARGIRATNASQAIRQYVRRPADVLIVNADHPHESAWLLAAKLQLTHPTARIWVYKRRLSDLDTATADFLEIDELIEHENDLCYLATEILDRLVELPAQASRLSDQGHGTATDQAVA